MRIATWNINSLRARMERVLAFLDRHDIDVLALQETKAKPSQLDLTALTEAGYEVYAHGLNQWNGVAVISRVGLSDVREELPDVPLWPQDGTGVVEARAVSAIVGDGLRIWSLYVPNGREIDHPHMAYKLRCWMLCAPRGRGRWPRSRIRAPCWWGTSMSPPTTRTCGTWPPSTARPMSPPPSGRPSTRSSTPGSPT